MLNDDSLRKDIETIPGVISSTGNYILAGSIAYDKKKDGLFKYVPATIVGVDPIDEKRVLTIHQHMVQGVFPDDLKEDEILLGANLSGGFDTVQTSDLGGVLVGDKVKVSYANGITRTYTVRGIFKITLGFISSSAIISKKEAEIVLSVHNVASEILVRVDQKKNSINTYVEKIKSMFPALRVEDYSKRLSTVGILVKAFNSVSFVVSIISIVVTTMTLFVMIYVNAISTRRQIGILKAIGIKENIIITSYIIQSLFFAILGIIGGLTLLFLIVTPYLDIYPIVMPFGITKIIYTTSDIIVDITCLIISAILAGYIPARIVTKQGILKAIWG